MTTLTYSNLQNLLNMTVSSTTCEEIMDHAINLLNSYGADLPNMTGVAGAKTWNGESREAGAIMEVACSIYSSKYLTSGGSSSVSVSSISMSSSTSTGSAGSENLAKDLARQLVEFEVDVG